jgi:hypothetical protein
LLGAICGIDGNRLVRQIPKIRPLHSSDNWGEFCVSREIL